MAFRNEQKSKEKLIGSTFLNLQKQSEELLDYLHEDQGDQGAAVDYEEYNRVYQNQQLLLTDKEDEKQDKQLNEVIMNVSENQSIHKNDVNNSNASVSIFDKSNNQNQNSSLIFNNSKDIITQQAINKNFSNLKGDMQDEDIPYINNNLKQGKNDISTLHESKGGAINELLEKKKTATRKKVGLISKTLKKQQFRSQENSDIGENEQQQFQLDQELSFQDFYKQVNPLSRKTAHSLLENTLQSNSQMQKDREQEDEQEPDQPENQNSANPLQFNQKMLKSQHSVSSDEEDYGDVDDGESINKETDQEQLYYYHGTNDQDNQKGSDQEQDDESNKYQERHRNSAQKKQIGHDEEEEISQSLQNLEKKRRKKKKKQKIELNTGSDLSKKSNHSAEENHSMSSFNNERVSKKKKRRMKKQKVNERNFTENENERQEQVLKIDKPIQKNQGGKKMKRINFNNNN